jgi:hypothetical protein
MEDEIGPNEEFICAYCLKDVKGRFIFCSQECEDKQYSSEVEQQGKE